MNFSIVEKSHYTRTPIYFHDSSIIFLQVQNAALAAMKDEMFELAARFTRVTKERDYMEKALNRLQVSNITIHLESLHIFRSI